MLNWIKNNKSELLVSIMINLAISLLIGWFYLWLSSKQAKPSYFINTPKKLVEINQATPNLHLFWGDEKIKNPYFLKIKFWNDGRGTLFGHDIKKINPLTIKFSDQVALFEVNIADKSPESLVVEISNVDYDKNEIQFNINTEETFEPNQGFVTYFIFSKNGKATLEDFEIKGGIKGFPDGWKNRRPYKEKKKIELPWLAIIVTYFTLLGAVVLGTSVNYDMADIKEDEIKAPVLRQLFDAEKSENEKLNALMVRLFGFLSFMTGIVTIYIASNHYLLL